MERITRSDYEDRSTPPQQQKTLFPIKLPPSATQREVESFPLRQSADPVLKKRPVESAMSRPAVVDYYRRDPEHVRQPGPPSEFTERRGVGEMLDHARGYGQQRDSQDWDVLRKKPVLGVDARKEPLAGEVDRAGYQGWNLEQSRYEDRFEMTRGDRERNSSISTGFHAGIESKAGANVQESRRLMDDARDRVPGMYGDRAPHGYQRASGALRVVGELDNENLRRPSEQQINTLGEETVRQSWRGEESRAEKTFTHMHPNSRPVLVKNTLPVDSSKEIDRRPLERDVSGIEKTQPRWREDRIEQFGGIHPYRSPVLRETMPRSGSKDKDLEIGLPSAARSVDSTNIRRVDSASVRREPSSFAGYQPEHWQRDQSPVFHETLRSDHRSPAQEYRPPAQEYRGDAWSGDQQLDWSTTSRQPAYVERTWEADRTSEVEARPLNPVAHGGLDVQKRAAKVSSVESDEFIGDPPVAAARFSAGQHRLPVVAEMPASNARYDETKDPFKYIYKTVATEQAGHGMFHCAVCNIHLGTDTDRSIHAHTEDHRCAVDRRDKAAYLSRPALSARGRPEPADGRVFQPRPIRGQRSARPYRPYGGRGGTYGQRGPSNVPRHAGPY